MKRWLFLLTLPCTLHAQTPAQDTLKALRRTLDSLEAKAKSLDSLKANYAHAYRKAFHPGRWYALTLAVGDGANAIFHVDTDNGGYRDAWGTPDKVAHFTLSSFLAERAMRLGVRPRDAFVLTTLGGIGFEFSQGHVSRKDIVADAAGAAFAWGVHWLVDRIPDQVKP